MRPSPVQSTTPAVFPRRWGGSVTMRFVRRSDSMPTGTLMRNTQRQLKLSVMNPPSVGPMAGARTTAIP